MAPFFALMSTAIAIRERTPPVRDTPTTETELVKELREYAGSLDVEKRLKDYGATLRALEDPRAKFARYFLLNLDPVANLNITGYRSNQLEQASNDYLETERAIAGRSGADAVLVSVDSLAVLRSAYPNYFLDTRSFIRAVRRAIGQRAR